MCSFISCLPYVHFIKIGMIEIFMEDLEEAKLVQTSEIFGETDKISRAFI